jgi:uncharacterized protein YbjQ (UPF0145 family)
VTDADPPPDPASGPRPPAEETTPAQAEAGAEDVPAGAESDPEVEASIARIEAGLIPLAAERRMRATGEGALPFSSTLSVPEFALTEKLGLKPVGQVMGASIHQIGYQGIPWTPEWEGQLLCELDRVSRAWEEARRLALDRLTEEARSAAADAVVGVSVRHGGYDWAAGAVDCVITGTAVRVPGAPMAWPVLSDLSGQDYWKLQQAGYAPAGLAMATAVFFCSPSAAVRWNRTMTMATNQELGDFTQAFYTARERLLGNLAARASAENAEGIVGVQIEQQIGFESLPVMTGAYGGSGDHERRGLLITMHATGTGIRQQQELRLYPPETTVRLSSPGPPGDRAGGQSRPSRGRAVQEAAGGAQSKHEASASE